MVDLANNILNDEALDVAELTDGDLWQKLQILSSHQRANFFRITWIPSHCDEEGPKRKRLLENGAINKTEIHGNSQADALAKQGANPLCLR